MKQLKEIPGIEIKRLEAEETSLGCQAYEIQLSSSSDTLRLSPDLASQVAIEILKDVFLGNGKPIPPAQAIQCLEAFLPRIEANPNNWWNRPEDHESDKR